MSVIVAAIVTKAVLAGSACKASDKVDARFSADGGELTVAIPAFVTKRRANCDVVVTTEHPAGVQMAPKSLRFTWSGEVSPSGAVELSFRYHFQGAAETPAGRLAVKTPGKVAEREDVVEVEKAVASKCGEKTSTLVVSLAALVQGAGRVAVTQASPVEVEWQACR
jgi:hypothetical protein